MQTLVATECKHNLKRTRNFGALYSAVILLSLHWAIVLYINSSYLEQYVTGTVIGILYTISSAMTVFTFLFISRVLHKAGNYTLTLHLAILEFCILIGMAMTDSYKVAIPLFMLHQAIIPLILFNLDIYMEEMIGDEEGSTGGRRGLFLTIMSFAGALAPLAAGYLIGDGVPRFSYAYIGSALLMVPFIFIIIRYFKTFKDPLYNEIKVLHALRGFWIKKDIRNVFFSHFLLQLFFSWMVIYAPIYLAVHIGFNWQEIGLILFVGLMAYVFLEYPIGMIADRWIGEKEMMAFGFLILAVSISWFAFIESASILMWMFAMFMTRVGASFVETTTESYFFKHTKGSDSNVISFFRITRPLSYVIGALIGSLTLLYLDFNLLFIVLGMLMIPGFFFAMALKDTK
jgi:MFS family permease